MYPIVLARCPPVRHGAETDSEDNKAPSENNRIHGSDHAVHGDACVSATLSNLLIVTCWPRFTLSLLVKRLWHSLGVAETQAATPAGAPRR
jgi:hypothetical protein